MGSNYALAFTLMFIALPTYILGLLSWLSSAFSTKSAPWMFRPLAALPVLIGGIFLMHYFGWVMGHIYRVYHRYFPWVNQGAVREDEAEPRGFAVVPPTKAPPAPVAPLPVSPLPVTPIQNATRSDQLNRVH